MDIDSYFAVDSAFDLARAQLVTTCYQTADLTADYETIKASLYVDDTGRFFAVNIGYSADGRRFSQTREMTKSEAHAWCQANSIDLDTIKRFFEPPAPVQSDLAVICLLTRKWHRDQAQT